MAKGDNQTQVQSALEPTDIEWLNSQNPGMGQRLNTVLTHLGNVLGAAAGHRGTVVLKKQKGKDTKGVVDATLDASEGRIENVEDPVKDLDAVNLRTLRRYLLQEEDNRLDAEEIKRDKPACRATALTNPKRIQTGLEVLYAVEVLNEHVYVLGEAGGLGFVQIYRIKESNAFVLVGSVQLGAIMQKMVLQGRYLYLTKGNSGLSLVDVEVPNAPTEVSQVGISGGRDVFSQGRWVYTAAVNGVNIVDVSVPTVPVVRGTAT